MTAEELSQLRNALVSSGRKVVVINLAAFSMSVGNITEINSDGAALTFAVHTEKDETVPFVLESPVAVVTTPTGYRFDSDKLVLQVDFMPD